MHWKTIYLLVFCLRHYYHPFVHKFVLLLRLSIVEKKRRENTINDIRKKHSTGMDSNFFYLKVCILEIGSTRVPPYEWEKKKLVVFILFYFFFLLFLRCTFLLLFFSLSLAEEVSSNFHSFTCPHLFLFFSCLPVMCHYD